MRRKIEHLESLTADIKKAGNAVVPIGCDARDEEQMITLFDRIENEIGELEVVVLNIGANVRFPIWNLASLQVAHNTSLN